MITKALLFVWLGFGQNQTMTITKMDSYAECTAALSALIAMDDAFDSKWVKCIPYEYRE